MSKSQTRSPMVIFVDDEKHLRNSTMQAFDLADIPIDSYSEAEIALTKIDRNFSGIVISDIRMPTMSGLDLLHNIHEIDPDLPVILVTGHADVQLAVQAMRKGAYDFVEKPFVTSNLIEIARRALEKRSLILQLRKLRTSLPKPDELDVILAGRSKIMVSLREQIRMVSQSETDVLLIGQTGTGKDVAARAVHSLGERAHKPFVSINCAALPVDLIESELFGHEIGAFPGAVRSRYGKFEHAQGGTIFLDGIESMPLSLQVKLLQVLQDRSITRLGSNQLIDLDVKFLAASKVDLEEQIRNGSFRADLYYRLNVVTLQMPDLQSRREDIPLLFSMFAREAALRHNRPDPSIAQSILARLMDQNWHGNVRELKNMAERFALGLEPTEEIATAENASLGLQERMAKLESEVISAELAHQKGSLRKTYEALGISRKSLYEKMQKHGLNRDQFLES